MKIQLYRGLTLVCAALAFITIRPDSARATVLYWDPEGGSFFGSPAGTWTTSATNWSTNTTFSSSSLVPWTPGSSACFSPGPTPTQSFNVTLTNTVSCTDIYNGALTLPGCSLNLTGTGAISLGSATNFFKTSGTGSTTFNVPITGSGAIVFAGTSSQGLAVANSYSGGTQLGTTASDFTGVITIGNNSAFGTGPINIVSSGWFIMTAVPVGSFTITNAWNTAAASMNFSSSSSSGLFLAGPWTLPNRGTVSIGSAGSGPVVISGVISGAGSFNKFNSGPLRLTATNTYTGDTIVSNGTLVVSATGSFNQSSKLTLYPGARLDVLANAAFALTNGQSLFVLGKSNNAHALIAGANGGTVNLSTNTVCLNYTPASFAGDPTHPALELTSGALSFNNNVLSISNTSATLLGPGTYRLIQDDGGAIIGAPNPTPQVSGLVANCTASLVVNNTNLDMVVTAPPSFNYISANPVMDANSGNIINVTISANLSAGATTPAPGESITVNLNGAIKTVKTFDSTGSFGATYSFVSIPYSPTNYPLTLSYGGNSALAPATTNTVIRANSFVAATAVSSGAPPLALYATNTTAVNMFVWSCTNASVPTTKWALEGQMTEQPLNDGSGKSVYSLSVNPEPAPMFYIIGPKNSWPFASPTAAQWIANDGNETFYSTNTTISAVGVLQLPSPPVILLQPASKTVLAGKNVGFSYSYSSTTTATNQWYFNLTNPLPAPTGFYLLTNVTVDNSGTYDFVISSEFGSATSEPITLTVVPPPQTTVQHPTNGTVELTATAAPSETYVVQVTTDLTPPINWLNLTTNTATTNGLIDFIDTNAPVATNLFYRLQFP